MAGLADLWTLRVYVSLLLSAIQGNSPITIPGGCAGERSRWPVWQRCGKALGMCFQDVSCGVTHYLCTRFATCLLPGFHFRKVCRLVLHVHSWLFQEKIMPFQQGGCWQDSYRFDSFHFPPQDLAPHPSLLSDIYVQRGGLTFLSLQGVSFSFKH